MKISQFKSGFRNLKAAKDWDGDGLGPFTCNLIGQNLGIKALNFYKYLFSRMEGGGYVSIGFGVINDDDERMTVRVAAVILFKEMCLEYKLYKDF